MRRRLAPLFTALILLACGNDDSEPLSAQLEDAQAHVDALRTEVDSHTESATHAADLTALRALEVEHAEMADAHMSELGHAFDDMDECENAPDDRMDAMMGMHGMCASELERHRQAVEVAADLASALDEEAHHHAEMMARIDDLGGMMDGMMDDYGMMMCHGHGGMDDRP